MWRTAILVFLIAAFCLVAYKCEQDRGSHFNGMMHCVTDAAASFRAREKRLPTQISEIPKGDFAPVSSRDWVLKMMREYRLNLRFERSEGKDEAVLRGMLHGRMFERRHIIQ